MYNKDMIRKEEEILNDIKAQQDKLKELCGPSVFGIYVKYIEEYDENGNLVKAILDPEVQKCYEEIRRLEPEYSPLPSLLW